MKCAGRVYDVTTCRSLGLEVDSFGNLTFKGGEGEEDVDKVHLEAVTEETFRQKKLEKAEDSQKRNGESSAHAEDEAELQSTEPAKEEFIRLLLKAKGEEDFKLKVKAVRHYFIPPHESHGRRANHWPYRAPPSHASSPPTSKRTRHWKVSSYRWSLTATNSTPTTKCRARKWRIWIVCRCISRRLERTGSVKHFIGPAGGAKDAWCLAARRRQRTSPCFRLIHAGRRSACIPTKFFPSNGYARIGSWLLHGWHVSFAQ